jgi:hypothetical protein
LVLAGEERAGGVGGRFVQAGELGAPEAAVADEHAADAGGADAAFAADFQGLALGERVGVVGADLGGPARDQSPG